jgi:hypothetical protein
LVCSSLAPLGHSDPGSKIGRHLRHGWSQVGVRPRAPLDEAIQLGREGMAFSELIEREPASIGRLRAERGEALPRRKHPERLRELINVDGPARGGVGIGDELVGQEVAGPNLLPALVIASASRTSTTPKSPISRWPSSR